MDLSDALGVGSGQANSPWPGTQNGQDSGGSVWPGQPPASNNPTWPGQPPASNNPTWPGQPPASNNPTWPGQPPASNNPTWPGQPSAPSQPSWPGQPSAPGQPPAPSQPTWPGQPPAPSQPTWPGQPSAPGQPPAPSQPTWPGQPSAPGQPPAPSQPTWPGQPSAPGQPPAPGQPSWPGQSPPQQVPLTVPYSMSLPRGVYDKLLITINGQMKPHPKAFTINLMRGKDIAIHFNPRFNEGGKKVIVRNSLLGGKWGTEERGLSHFPFSSGQNFEIKFLCTHNEFKVAVNRAHLLEFKHRIRDLSQINHLTIYDDITLTSVNIESLP